VDDLGAAEAAMLELTCERAELADGQDILELGCGWGSLTLWMAARYPRARITAVSNSAPQREFIEAECRRRGLGNVTVLTANLRDWSAPSACDRIVSVEMFEHMRNYEELLRRVSTWLRPGGKLFVHIFTHRRYAYLFEAKDESDWMSKYFFTGGQMPSDHLLLYFQRDLLLERHWRVSGRHYERTLRAWLARQDAARGPVLEIFRSVYGPEQAERWFHRWRIFFLSCAELFGYRGGDEWMVSHYRFARRS
jgi:cyclopropane-fatty-acyl-phospholipid synthase